MARSPGPRWRPWAVLTSFGSINPRARFLLGGATVGYRTSLADLALMGALTGLVLGVAQAVALPRRTHRRWTWAAALPLLWALGWTATTLGGIAVDEQFTVFGAYGALTFSLLSGLLLHWILPVDVSAGDAPGSARRGRGSGRAAGTGGRATGRLETHTS